MANPIRKNVKTGGIPVIKKDLDSGVIAEANNDGTIFLDKKVKNNSPLAKEAIAHEMVHMDQMARGDLDYNDNNVIWKGKKYSRKKMNEGSENLPWEKEAYNKTKNMKKSPAKLSLSKGALDTNRDVIISDLESKAGKRGAIVGAVDGVLGEVKGFDAFSKSGGSGKKGTNPNPEEKKETPLNMKATPITKKSQYGGSPGSPLHVETKTTEEFEGNNTETDEFGNFVVTDTTKSKTKTYDDMRAEGASEADIEAAKKFNMDNYGTHNPTAEVEGVDNTTTTSIRDAAFTPKELESQKKGTPGTPDKKNMGYYESMDAKWGAGVRNRGNKKVNRIANRAGKKFDKGKSGLNPETGEAWASKAEYVKAQAAAAKGNYDVGVGKVKLGEKGTEDGPVVKSNEKSRANAANYDADGKPIVKETEKVESSPMNSNKNKSAFKMKKSKINQSVRDAVGDKKMTGKQGDFNNEYDSTEEFIGGFRGDELKSIVKHEGANTPEERAKAYKTLGKKPNYNGKSENKYDGWQTEDRVVTDYDTAYKDRNRDTYGDMSKKEYIGEAKRQKKSFIDKGDFDAPAKMKSAFKMKGWQAK